MHQEQAPLLLPKAPKPEQAGSAAERDCPEPSGLHDPCKCLKSVYHIGIRTGHRIRNPIFWTIWSLRMMEVRQWPPLSCPRPSAGRSTPNPRGSGQEVVIRWLLEGFGHGHRNSAGEAAEFEGSDW